MKNKLDGQKLWYKNPIVLIIMSLLFIGFLWTNYSSGKNTESAPVNQDKGESQIEHKTGEYLSYSYTILKQEGQRAYGATFKPFLARNDTIVTGAMLEMINQTYGKNKVSNLSPKVVDKNGQKTVQFEGINEDYYFLLIKEDTGEVNSLVFWSE